MKIVQINATCGVGSTGKICVEISELLSLENIENYILYSYQANKYELGIGCSNKWYLKAQAFKSKLIGNYGFNSKLATLKIISQLKRIQPDIVHLHNIHGHDCDIRLLFNYFKKNNVRLVWTFHDCWAFTGYCTYFDLVKCNKWKTGCNSCENKSLHSWLFDRSKSIFEKKKKLFSDLDLTIVTPSVWLADLVSQSFLASYSTHIINNGIDLDIFKPYSGDFKLRYKIAEDKKILLGVAFDWGIRKGLDVFVELSKRLPGDYQIVLVGTNSEIDKQLPRNIISIHRTQNQRELAEIYSAADVFVNPTREENYPTVNMEALACGTPIVTFNTGGSAEILDHTCGSVVDCDDVDALEREIVRICTERPYTKEACITRAKGFDKTERYKEYIKLYESINS